VVAGQGQGVGCGGVCGQTHNKGKREVGKA